MKFYKLLSRLKITAQNAGNAICGILDFKIFRGGHAPGSPRKPRAYAARIIN